MACINRGNYFLALSLLAIILLWGISLMNGFVKALIIASWYGVFEDGTSLKTSYTGIFPIDFLISLLVAFFYYGTNGSVPAYQHFLIDGYSTLQSGFIWLYVESGREISKPAAVANPIIWGIAWQCLGAAISLPLYYHYHLNWLRGQSVNIPSISPPFAKAIPISFAVGAFLPAVVGMLPTWVDRGSQTHQVILALWQLDPVWVSLVQSASIAIISLFHSTDQTSDGKISSPWIRFSYLVGALCSATGHIYAVVKIAVSTEPSMSLLAAYVPKDFTGLRDNLKLIDGPWLYLQYDCIIIALSSLSWAYLLVSDLSASPRLWKSTRLGLFILGYLVVGAGGTVSLALFWREDVLQRKRNAANRKTGSIVRHKKGARGY